MKIAFITGVTGQIGSFLAEILLQKGYKVIGLKRRTSLICTDRIDHIYNHPNFELKYFDLDDIGALYPLLMKYTPNEFYNFAAMSHVKVSFEQPEYAMRTCGSSVVKILEAIRLASPFTKFYQSSSSEIFGNQKHEPGFAYDENSIMLPSSPYAIGKLCAHHTVRTYRESYNLQCYSAINFNTESERRGETFVTRKISQGIAKIALGMQGKIHLGNIDSIRDWGYAKDTAKAAYLMLQKKPDDFVVATGQIHSVREFVEKTLECANLKCKFEDVVKIDKKYYRPNDVEFLRGNSQKLQNLTGWTPTINFDQLVEKMFQHDFDLLKEK